MRGKGWGVFAAETNDEGVWWWVAWGAGAALRVAACAAAKDRDWLRHCELNFQVAKPLMELLEAHPSAVEWAGGADGSYLVLLTTVDRKFDGDLTEKNI